MEKKDKWAQMTTGRKLAVFGRDQAAGFTPIQRVYNFLRQLFNDPKRAGLYENVSLEYMLRCLAENDGIKKGLAGDIEKNTKKVAHEFNRVARKFEEYSSSVSVSFKHHAQGWSIGIGILLAVSANIDGVKIFQAYMANQALTEVVKKNYAHSSMDNIEGNEQLDILNDLGVPFGWDSFLEKLEKDSDEGHQDKSLWFTVGDAVKKQASSVINTIIAQGGPLLWLFKVAITGVLIGLGAPFWFDVAKRLSQIRKGATNETASREYRMSAQDANGDPKVRRRIVNTVLEDIYEVTMENEKRVSKPAE